MNNIIKIGDKRERSIEENFQTLSDQARIRFSQLAVFKGQSYDSNTWRYQGENLFFSTPVSKSKNAKREAWPEEVEETFKLLIIGHLWDSRVRTNPLSFSRIKGLRDTATFLIKAGMIKLEDLTSDIYHLAFTMIIDHYKKPITHLQNFNSYINYLQDEYLLKGNIDILSAARNKLAQEKQGLPAVKEKMPIPELVRAVIQLKWLVEESHEKDPTDHRLISDLFSVYTQAFQYGMGLRIGEVLRLPHDCLQTVNGELYLKIWTEKGMTPNARYVPKIWRSLLTDIVEKVTNLTEPYRKFTRELEDKKKLSVVRSRLESFKATRDADAKAMFEELEAFMAVKIEEAKDTWQLKTDVDPSREYTLDDLVDILPISSTAKSTPDKVKAYTKWDLVLTITPIDSRRKRYTVIGQEILDFIERQINLRTNSITEQEFLSILHGRDVHRQNSGDKTISQLTSEAWGSTASCYTFSPSEFKGKGRAPAVMSLDDALAKLTSYAHGGYDINTHIDVLSFREVFPELVLMSSNSDTDFKEINKNFDISKKQKISVKVKTEDQYVRYSVSSGYTVSQASIESYIYNRFTDNNFKLEKELYEADLQDAHDDLVAEAEAEKKGLQVKEKGFEATALTIQSKSFKVEQKVSEHLFLRAEITSGGAEPNPLIPEILGYQAVKYFFTGNDRYENGFTRYGSDIPIEVTDTWQSHKGRHWQTTSLFRAGVSEAIVNKWLGRTQLQGLHYDHNTGSERAKAVGELMMEDSNRFVGHLAQKIRQFQYDEIPVTEIHEYMDETMQTAQHTPVGYCIRSLNLKPCELNLMCLVGKDGDGCKHFIFDLKDDYQKEKLQGEIDKSEIELERLIDAYDNGAVAAKPHIDRHVRIYKNGTHTLEAAANLLGTPFSDTKQEFMPFFKDGSYPDDCPFQCGDD